MPEAQLAVRDVHTWYGESHILHGMSFDVNAGEVVTLLGRNGAGKTTTMRAIMGILSQRRGSIRYEGRELIRLKSNRIARQGIAYCPEERGIFSSLNVRENLMLPPRVKPGGLSVEELHRLFPNLKERAASQGTKLSGGEQQMAPVIVQHIGNTIRLLREQGFTILLVEQNFRFAATVADRHYVVEHGRVIDMIPSASLAANREKLQTYLGV
jgi:branched-chain amino acid transport system ATP-binding protein